MPRKQKRGFSRMHGRTKEFLCDRLGIRNTLTFPSAWNKTRLFTPYLINNAFSHPDAERYDSLFSGL